MNLIGNLMVKDLPPNEVAVIIPERKNGHIAQGICITCINKAHCVWLENKKLLCEHFD